MVVVVVCVYGSVGCGCVGMRYDVAGCVGVVLLMLVWGCG